MFRSASCRWVAAFALVLCLSSLAPAWAAGSARQPSPAAPAAAAVQHAGALATAWAWLQGLVAKAAGQPGGRHIVIDVGICNDPNGQCTGG